MVQNLLIGILCAGVGVDTKDHVDLILVDLDPFNERANQFTPRRPICSF